jgi:hypothetical protein
MMPQIELESLAWRTAQGLHQAWNNQRKIKEKSAATNFV